MGARGDTSLSLVSGGCGVTEEEIAQSPGNFPCVNVAPHVQPSPQLNQAPVQPLPPVYPALSPIPGLSPYHMVTSPSGPASSHHPALGITKNMTALLLLLAILSLAQGQTELSTNPPQGSEILESTAEYDLRTDNDTQRNMNNESSTSLMNIENVGTEVKINESQENPTVSGDSSSTRPTSHTDPANDLQGTSSSSPQTTADLITTFEDFNTTVSPDDSENYVSPFFYDYYSLRQWGLIAAMIFFILGILVLFSERCNRCNCRRRQKRKYNITGV